MFRIINKSRCSCTAFQRGTNLRTTIKIWSTILQNVNALPAQTIELKDIHIPEQISSFPIAYGWWILAALFIVLIIISIINIRKHIKRNAIKKNKH